MLKRPKIGELVQVCWLDIQTDNNWVSRRARLLPAECETVGWVLSADGPDITLGAVQSGDSVNLRMTVPWVNVTKVQHLVPRKGRA